MANVPYSRELFRSVTATPMRYITAAHQQNLAGLEALRDLAKVWADIPQTAELGAVDVFLSHLREDLVPTPSTPGQWQHIDGNFAFMSLYALSFMDNVLDNPNFSTQTDAIFSGLPGIIKWSQYIYDAQLEDVHQLIQLLSACVQFQNSKWAPTLANIPGGLELVTKLWMWGGVSGSVDAARVLALIIVYPTSRGERDRLDRVVEAADGDAAAIARLAIRQVKKATKTLDTETKQKDLSVFVNVISPLCRPLPPSPHPLHQAFFDGGVITALTRSFATVSRLIPSTGFLRALLDCSPAFPQMIYHDLVKMALRIVREILPPYTVYRSLVGAVAPFLQEFREPRYKALLAQPMVSDSFAPFLATLERRLPAMAQYEDGGREGAASSRCHNIKCQRLNAQLKRCEACQTVYYCSVECQRFDWETTHRKLCQPFAMERPLGHRAKRDIECVRVIAKYTADTNHIRFRAIAERDFLDTPHDQLIPWIDFTCVPETLSIKLVQEAVEWDPNLPPFMERCRSWGVITVGCSRRNGTRNENLWLPAGRRDFWTDESAGELELDLGWLSFEDDTE
ncbi:hypothetical protein FB45DRAFT_920555 [Roridomyces roridus]|uniref:MYND-type domain-containing protein n=1 Tax=Roridomyces roridus TaxID=1738132 RepID=A0AAD7BPQ8_9AGAR|nr:hypothetical protein FB45DRAFT_920555 [Roridomyces roridus]